MFDIFGELSSADEINELAENLYNEGDTESIFILAKENGIDREFVEMYLSGELYGICDDMTAAMGKIELEEADLKPKEIMVDWIEYLKCQVAEDENLAKAVRKKGKSVKGMIAAMLKWSFANQQNIDKSITEAAGVKARVTLGIPGMERAKKIILDYYGG